MLEAEAGIEPAHIGFADQCLPTWRLRRYRLKGNLVVTIGGGGGNRTRE
jgi:hypothetical protein